MLISMCPCEYPVVLQYMSKLNVYADSRCQPMVQFYGSCCMSMSMLHVHVNATCPFGRRMTMLVLHVHLCAACSWCFSFCMFIRHVQAACPYCMLMSPCCLPCCLSMLLAHNFHFACLLHVHAACPWSMSKLPDHVAMLHVMLHVHAACPSRMQRSRRLTWAKLSSQYSSSFYKYYSTHRKRGLLRYFCLRD